MGISTLLVDKKPAGHASKGTTAQDQTTWQQAVGELKDAIKADVCAIGVHYYETGAGRFTHSSGIDPEYLASYEKSYSRCNVWLQPEERFRIPGTVWADEQLVARPQLKESTFYKGWVMPQNLAHHIFGVIERKGKTVVCLVLARKADKPPFTDGEAAYLGVMLRAVGSAWRMERSARARVAHTGAAWNVLNRLTLGIILLDHVGKIAAVNLKALEVLKRGDTLTAFNGSLSLSLPQENLQLQTILDEFLVSSQEQSSASSKALAVSRPDGKTPIHLIMTRVTNGTAAHGSRRNLIAVFLSDPEQLGTPREEWLQDLYGLTRVESRLAVLMCQGLTPDEIAKKLRISVHTVRAYLKDVFLKMGVNRQAAMVRRLVDGPGQLRTDSALDQRLAATIGPASTTAVSESVRVN